MDGRSVALTSMSQKFTLFDPDTEPTDEELAEIMHEAGDRGRQEAEAARRWCREQIALALRDAMASHDGVRRRSLGAA